MRLMKTVAFAGFATAARVITGITFLKVAALYTGPSGMALLGQLQSFLQMVLQFATGAIQTGVVKYTAELKESYSDLKRLLNTATVLIVSTSALASLFLVVFSGSISTYLFQSQEYNLVLQVLGFSLIFFVFNQFFLSILNGFHHVKKYSFLNVCSSLISLGLTVVLTKLYGLIGLLTSCVSNSFFVFLLALFLVKKEPWFKKDLFLGSADKKMFQQLMTFALMAVVSATVFPMAHIYMRNYSATQFGWEHTGYWESMWKFSQAYLSLITMTLSVYYLPKLSSLHCPKEIKSELLRGYKVIMPVMFVMVTVIFFCSAIIKIPD